MKVLKGGKVPTKAEFFRDAKLICVKRDEHDTDGCGAELQYREKDLLPRYWEASHSNKYYFVVVCPRCSHDCIVKPPHVIWRELMTREMRQDASFDGFSDRG